MHSIFKLCATCIIVINIGIVSIEASSLLLSDNGPIVIGAEITFTVEIVGAFGGEFQFYWQDDAIPKHSYHVEGNFLSTEWKVSYPPDVYVPGIYEVEVRVYRKYFPFYYFNSARLKFEITALLNGKMELLQSNKTRDRYIANNQPLTHKINLEEPDREYISTNNTLTRVFWFIDCIYYGYSSDLFFNFNYPVINSDHTVEVLIVADHNPPPLITTTTSPPTTTTTPTPTTQSPTTSPPTTPSTTTTIATTTTTTTKPSFSGTTLQPSITTLNSNISTSTSNIEILTNRTETTVTEPTPTTTTTPPSLLTLLEELPYNTSVRNTTFNVPYVCLNSSVIAIDTNKTYGYFHRTFQVKAPISNLKFEGTNWLQHGDILNLTITCEGSGYFRSCYYFERGQVNITGNETCTMRSMEKCYSKIERYLGTPQIYTLIYIVENPVSKNILHVSINIYEVNKRAQLSVIVVPVSCSLVAVILIVFGVAYYMQNRSRYTIEVANFDFGQSNDLEYKTFRERLRDSFSDAFARTQDYHNNWRGINSTRGGVPEPGGYTNLE